MTDGNRVELDTSDLVAAMRRFLPGVERSSARAALDTAANVGDRARSNVPRVSGRLAASIRAEKGVGEVDAVARMGEGVPYAGWIEFGGTRGRARVPEGRYLGAASRTATAEFARACETVADREARNL